MHQKKGAFRAAGKCFLSLAATLGLFLTLSVGTTIPDASAQTAKQATGTAPKTLTFEAVFDVPKDIADPALGKRTVHLIVESIPNVENGVVTTCTYRWRDKLGEGKPPLKVEFDLTRFERIFATIIAGAESYSLTLRHSWEEGKRPCAQSLEVTHQKTRIYNEKGQPAESIVVSFYTPSFTASTPAPVGEYSGTQ